MILNDFLSKKTLNVSSTILPVSAPASRGGMCTNDRSSRRRRILASLTAVVFFAGTVDLNAQSVASYSVARATGITYFSIAGSSPSYFAWRNTSLNQNDDNRSFQAPIGFDFWYLGVRYTSFSASLNGLIDFSSSTSDANTSPYAYGSPWQHQWYSDAGGQGSLLGLAPLYADLWTQNYGTVPISSSLYYLTTGTAPNRVLTVEWLHFDGWNSPVNATPADINMQVKIYESTGVIEFLYGTMTTGASNTGGYYLRYASGINGSALGSPPTATQLLTQQTANTTTFDNGTQDQLTVLPTSNSKLTFIPPVPAAPTGLSFSAITKTAMTLNWTDNASNEDGYVIYNSTDNVNFTYVTQFAANSISAPITGLVASTTYYWQVYAVTEGTLSTALTGSKATLAQGNVTSIASGNWSNPLTWDNGVPTAGDNVFIANTHIVVLDVNGACNTLTVGQGASGQLTIGNDATARTLAVNTNVTVSAGATLTTGATAATHSMTMGGNLVNNGLLNLAPTAARVCNVTFTNNGNQTISGTGATTNFNLITLNMGTSSANVLEVTSTNFTVVPTNFLTFTNGTFKLSTATAVLTPFTGNVTIPLSAGIWLNNAGATLLSTGGTITLFGTVHVTAGTFNVGNASDNSLTSSGGTLIVDGGTVNIAGRLDKVGVNLLTYFTMSSGTLTVATIGSTLAGAAPFRMDEIGSTFNLSGGTIIVRRPGAGNLGFINTGGTVGSVTGGTLQMGDGSTPAGQTMLINSSIAVYHLVVSNGVAVTAQLLTNPLTVKGNLTVNSGTLNDGGLQITGNVAGTMTMAAGTGLVLGTAASATLFPTLFPNANVVLSSTSTVTYNSNVAQTISGVPTYGNLTLSATAAVTKTLSAPATVNGNLTINANNTLSDGGFQITGNGAGTLTMAAGTQLTLGTAASATALPTLFTNSHSALNATSTVTYNSNLAQIISGVPTYGNVTLASTGAVTKTLGAATTMAGALTIGANNTLDVSASNFAVNIAGNWTNNGGAYTPGSGTVTFTGSAAAINGTTVTQTFNNVIVNKTAGQLLSVAGSTTTLNVSGNFAETTGNFTAPTTMSVTGGVTLTAGTFTAGTNVSVGVNWTNNGGTFTPGAGTVTFTGNASAINGTAVTQTFNNIVVNKTAGQLLNVGGSTTTLNVSGSFTETTGNFTAPTTMSVTGGVTLTAGTFTAGTTVNDGGNWTNNGGAFTPGTGTVTFNGVTQAIGGTAVTTFKNLTLGGTGAKTANIGSNISGALTVNQPLTMSGANILTMLNGASQPTFTGLTEITGNMTWQAYNAGAYTFNNAQTIVTFTGADGARTFTVQSAPNTYPSFGTVLAGHTVKRDFNVTYSSWSTGTATLQLAYLQGEASTLGVTESRLRDFDGNIALGNKLTGVPTRSTSGPAAFGSVSYSGLTSATLATGEIALDDRFGTFKSIAAAAWNVATTWDQNDVPSTLDYVTVDNSFPVTIPDGYTAAALSVTINATSTGLTVGAGTSGVLNVGSGGLTNNSAGTGLTVSPGANVTITGGALTNLGSITNNGSVTVQ